MAIYYVSNTAVNGTYVVGNDGNAGTTPATAKLTITGAIAAASASDTIYINPTGVSYSENSSGLNYLQINKANLIIETDPTYVISVGKATITSPAAGTRTINMNETGITLRNVRVDNASQTRNCIFCQSFASHSYSGIDFYNLGANAIAITAQNNNAYNITIDKCTLLSANGNAAGTKLHQITGTLGGIASRLFAKVNLGTNATFTNYATLATFQAATSGDANSLDTAAELYNNDILSPPISIKGFTLQADSTAIATGEVLAFPTIDYLGVTRIDPNTIGAIDYIRRYGSGSRTLTDTRELV